jgi:hypothetical protein
LGATRETRSERKLCRIDAVGNDTHILPLKIIRKERGGTLGDRAEGNFLVFIDASFQPGQKSVVRAAMATAKKARLGRFDIELKEMPRRGV